MKEKTKDKLLGVWIATSMALVLGLVSFILIYIFKNGYKEITREFLLEKPKGLPLGQEGGIYPAIIGSIYLMILSSGFASIFSLATAIYLNFYTKKEKRKQLIQMTIQCLAGIPSIILGLFGYTLFVLKLNLGRSLLSASLTLAIMIFPYIEVRVENIISQVDPDLIKASYALGMPKYYTILRLVLPICKKGILASITMAAGFAMGASAPIVLTGAVLFADSPKSLKSPIMALPVHLYILTNEGISLDKAYGTALVLILMLILINGLALGLGKLKGED